MRLLARFPSLTAWVVVLALIAVGTLAALQGLRALQPSVPGDLEHMHGVIVATRAGDMFGVEVSGHTKLVWFRVDQGAPISFAHILRHMREHAPTDIYYEEAQNGEMPLAWIAD